MSDVPVPKLLEDRQGIALVADLLVEHLEISRQILATLDRMEKTSAAAPPAGDPPPDPPAVLACPECGSTELEHQGTIGEGDSTTYYCRKGHVFLGPAFKESD